jgi:hypothetical protein
MTHEKAMQILDKVREGQNFTKEVIDLALQLTGDLELKD